MPDRTPLFMLSGQPLRVSGTINSFSTSSTCFSNVFESLFDRRFVIVTTADTVLPAFELITYITHLIDRFVRI